jgi:hypothetical protein
VASVNFQECYDLIPRLLEKNYPGRWHRDEIGDMPFWEVNYHQAAVSTVSLVENGDNSVIKVATGLVMGIPPHPEIVEHVNGLNVEVPYGTALVERGEGGVRSVLTRLLAPSVPLSWAHPPTITAFASLLRVMVETAPDASIALQKRFDGQYFPLGSGALVIMAT